MSPGAFFTGLLERLLYRIGQSQYKDTFILKGAALFQLWTGQRHRSTRDLDLLGYGDSSENRLLEIFCDVCSMPVEDGLTFNPVKIVASPIKAEDEYSGVRIEIDAKLESARLRLQIDIGFGDAVVPDANIITFPTLLDHPPPQLRAYHRETVIAEKFHAITVLGMTNSRMKDFYDIWVLARDFPFDGARLSDSIKATFDRRDTELPSVSPVALTQGFSTDAAKMSQWTAFVRRGRLLGAPPSLTDVVNLVESFLMPPASSLARNNGWTANWRDGRWQ